MSFKRGDYVYFPARCIYRRGWNCDCNVFPKMARRLNMDDSTIAGLIGVSVFLVSFVIAVLITVKSKY